MLRFKLFFVLLGLSAATGLAADSTTGEIVSLDARSVFVPIGFDDNDEVEAVVEGFLPNDCYRLTAATTEIDRENKVITIVPKARYFETTCVLTRIPFHFTANFGQLTEGSYTIKVSGPAASLTEDLVVRHSFNPTPDDFSYIPVDSVHVDLDRVTHKMVATIKGRLTSTCMRWSESRIEDNGKTINILPILTYEALSRCDAIEEDFERTVVLPDSISRGRHLLHVRSLNGRAVNTLFFKL